MNRQQRILEEVSQTAIALLLREPFYAHLLGSINKEIVGTGHEVDSLAVGPGRMSLTLFVNADFWDGTLTAPEHRYGVLKHEMLHLVFKHLLVDAQNLDPLLLNISFDLVVNQYIDRAQLPDDSVFLESFPDLQLQPGQTWYYYYKQIETARDGGQQGDKAGSPSAEQLQNISADSHGLERHQPWRELRSRSELEKSIVDTHVESLLRNAQQRTSAQAWGALPGDIREILPREQGRPAELPWRMVLRLFAGNASHTRLQNTLKRSSKRFGTTPGIKIRRRHRLLVAVDTSGSIGQAELDVFFKEIFFLWRAGAEVEVVECDTRIQQRYAYRGQTPGQVAGRGGTDFNEALTLANRLRPDGLIYFTDGYADTPAVKPRIPVLWILTKGGLALHQPAAAKLPGRKVKMEQ